MLSSGQRDHEGGRNAAVLSSGQRKHEGGGILLAVLSSGQREHEGGGILPSCLIDSVSVREEGSCRVVKWLTA